MKILLVHPCYSFPRHFNDLEIVLRLLDSVYGVECDVLVCDKAVFACGFRSGLGQMPETPCPDNWREMCEPCQDKLLKRLQGLYKSKVRLSDYISVQEKNFIKAEIAKLPNPVKLTDLLTLKFADINIGIDIWQSIQRYLFMGTPDQINRPLGSVSYEYIKSGITYALVLQRIFNARNYDLVLTNEIGYLDWGIPTRVALNYGVPVIHQSHAHYGLQHLLLRLYKEPQETKRHYIIPYADELREIYSDPCKLQASAANGKQVLLQRFNQAKSQREQSDIALECKKWFRPDRKTVVVFTHLCWDASITFGDLLFPTFEQWLTSTFEIAQSTPEVDWLFRIHPYEKQPNLSPHYNTYLHLMRLLSEHTTDNIRVMDNSVSSRLRTNDIAPFVHAGITAVGEIGYELPSLGVPCITACRKGLCTKEFAIMPQSISEYIMTLKDVVNIPPPTPRQQELALAYTGIIVDKKQYLDVSELFDTEDSSEEVIDQHRLEKWLIQPANREFIKRVIERVPSKLQTNNKMTSQDLVSAPDKTKQYPKVIRQTALNKPQILFEVTNSTEQWRVQTLDDEEEFLHLLLNELRRDDILYDIGACVGLYALYAARQCKRVFSFEPDPGFQKRILRNCEINGVSNVSVIPYAVSDKRGRVTDGVAGRSPSLRNLGQQQMVSVEAYSLDDIITSGQLPPPTVIKMDIEGAELHALRGMKELLSSTGKPRLIFIEVHPLFLPQFGGSVENVLELFVSNGYKCVYKSTRDAQTHYIFVVSESRSAILGGGKKIHLIAPNISESELEDIRNRVTFYAPDLPPQMLNVASKLPAEAVSSTEPVLLFGDARLLPDSVRNDRSRFFDIDYRRNPTDGWEWSRLANCLAKYKPDIDKSKERFKRYVDKLRQKDLKRAYLFGTGPSLEKAIERDFSDGYRIVCNTIVRDRQLWNHIKPHFIVAGDAIYHFGFTQFALAFRKDLKARLSETETFFVYPELFDVIVQREFSEFRERLVPVPTGHSKRVDMGLTRNFELPGLGNILSLMLLPLGCTLSKNVYLWGFDGRAPDDKLFWSNSNKHSYTELIPGLQKAHPMFFDHFARKTEPNWYIKEYFGDSLDNALTQAENKGFSFIMMHKSWTPTLAKRCVPEISDTAGSALSISQPKAMDVPRNIPTPWTAEYRAYRKQYISAVFPNTVLRDVFRKGLQLPENYGIGVDERCIELPWFFSVADQNANKVLDAGSALNHEHIIEHPYWKDKNLTILTLAPENSCFWRTGISYHFSDLRNTPFRDGYFDEIACISSLEHVGMDNIMFTGNSQGRENNIHDFKNALREMYRILKPGGRLLLTVPFGRYKDYGLFQQFDKALLDQAGYAFGAVCRQERFYRYTPRGWRLANSPQECADLDYSAYALQKWGSKVTSRPSDQDTIIPAAAAVACCIWQRDSQRVTKDGSIETADKLRRKPLECASAG